MQWQPDFSIKLIYFQRLISAWSIFIEIHHVVRQSIPSQSNSLLGCLVSQISVGVIQLVCSHNVGVCSVLCIKERFLCPNQRINYPT
jgi:hypothetical protein